MDLKTKFVFCLTLAFSSASSLTKGPFYLNTIFYVNNQDIIKGQINQAQMKHHRLQEGPSSHSTIRLRQARSAEHCGQYRLGVPSTVASAGQECRTLWPVQNRSAKHCGQGRLGGLSTASRAGYEKWTNFYMEKIIQQNRSAYNTPKNKMPDKNTANHKMPFAIKRSMYSKNLEKNSKTQNN